MAIAETIRPVGATVTPFGVTLAAAQRIAAMAAPGEAFRVEVKAGGCSGFQYAFALSPAAADDVIIEAGGARVVIDPVSLPLLAGAQLDYVDELIGAAFRITNPNAASGCGCGVSFAL